MVEHQTANLEVVSSNPALSKTFFSFFSLSYVHFNPKSRENGRKLFKEEMVKLLGETLLTAQKKERKRKKKDLPKAGFELTTTRLAV